MEEVTLRPITLSDTDLIVRWRNSDAVRLNMLNQRILTAEQHWNYYHQFVKQGHIVQYIIEIKTLPIGTVFYKKNDETIELGIFIGEDGYRGNGYGRIALSWILTEIKTNYLFKSIIVKVRSSNIRAIRLYESLGFSYLSEIADDIVEMRLI